MTAVVGALIIARMVYADMIPVSQPNIPDRYPLCVSTQANLQPMHLPSILNDFGPIALDVWRVEWLTETPVDVRRTSHIQHSLNLTDAPSSFTLCLYALMSLALFKSSPWIKKLSFGHVPEWYHDGGPFQIGHSLIMTPESLCSVPTYCLIQPVLATRHLIPQYRLRTIVSLGWKSQFTPDVIAPRGPPLS